MGKASRNKGLDSRPVNVAIVTGCVFRVPIRTRNGLNDREHWSARSRRVKTERAATRAAFERLVFFPHTTDEGATYTVRMTRIAPRRMDDDNLAGALKGVRDEIAACLGVNDGSARVLWGYDQSRGLPKEYAVMVRIDAQAKGE